MEESEIIKQKTEPAYRGPYIPPEELKTKKSGVNAAGIVALALSCSLIGGAGGAFGMYAIMNRDKEDAPPPEEKSVSVTYAASRQLSEIEIVDVESNAVLSDAEIYRANVASTVGITSSVQTTNIWGYPTTGAASGSGFIYSKDGFIVTNYHVVEGSRSVSVTTYDGTTYDAELIGYDEASDVAVLKINAKNLIPVVIGSSKDLVVGNHVVAIGNPLGELTFSLTQGAVSSLNRNVTFSSGTAMKLIQTDCAINSGNSGGALFNDRGEVIGITNAKYSSSAGSASIDNIGFAIPIDNVLRIINSIVEQGYVSRPFIGVTVSSVSEEAQQYGLPAGAAIQSVTEGSPAEKAGLMVNDIITAVDGESLSTHSDLVAYIGACAPGDELELRVYRSGEELTLSITVGEARQTAAG